MPCNGLQKQFIVKNRKPVSSKVKENHQNSEKMKTSLGSLNLWPYFLQRSYKKEVNRR